jgi:hypothetical protein
VPLPAKEVARDRVLDDDELDQVILAARKIGGPYGGIVELLALTGQRREEEIATPASRAGATRGPESDQRGRSAAPVQRRGKQTKPLGKRL